MLPFSRKEDPWGVISYTVFGKVRVGGGIGRMKAHLV